MKPKMLSAFIASALVTAAITTVTASAATADVTSKQAVNSSVVHNVLATQAGTATLHVDGVNFAVKTLGSGNATLYSALDLSYALGASYTTFGSAVVLFNEYQQVVLKAGEVSYTANGNAASFTSAPVQVGDTVYVPLQPIVDALGGDVQGEQIHSTKVLAGSFSAPRIVSNNAVIVSKDDADSVEVYKLRAVNNRNQIVSTDDGAATLVVSPDGKFAVYNNAASQLVLLDLGTGVSKVWSTDNSVKTDIAWTSDSSVIYFAQGDKQEKLASLRLDSDKIQSVLADKVENKSSLSLSADGKKLVYTVSVTGVATQDADSTEESLKIDYSKAGDQLYSLDLSMKNAKPVQLTTALDNKVYSNMLNDGTVVYVSADPNGANANDVMKQIAADGKTIKDLVSEPGADVIWDGVTANNEIVVAVAGASDTQFFKLAADGTRTVLFSTKGDVSEVSMSQDGTAFALIVDGKVTFVQNGKVVELTQ